MIASVSLVRPILVPAAAPAPQTAAPAQEAGPSPALKKAAEAFRPHPPKPPAAPTRATWKALGLGLAAAACASAWVGTANALPTGGQLPLTAAASHPCL